MYPNQFHIELTQKCNLNCLHCFADANMSRNQELNLTQVKQICEKMEQLGMVYANLSGGEPLLNKDFFPIVQYMLDTPFETCILTNGLLWNYNLIKKLSDLDNGKKLTIQISLDGMYKVMHRQRGMSKKQFQKIINVISLFRQFGFRVGILIVVNDLTIATSIHTIRYALKELHVDAVQAIPMFPTGRAEKNLDTLQLFWNDWEKFVIEITNIKKYEKWGADSQKVNIGFFSLYEIVLPLDNAGMHDEIEKVWGLDITSVETFKKQTKREHFCEAGQSEMVISSEGKIYPCIAALGSCFSSSDIKSSDIVTIWKEDEVLNFFRTVKNKVTCHEPCNQCEYKDICGGGCRVATKSLLNDMYAPDPRCPKVQMYKRDEHKCNIKS